MYCLTAYDNTNLGGRMGSDDSQPIIFQLYFKFVKNAMRKAEKHYHTELRRRRGEKQKITWIPYDTEDKNPDKDYSWSGDLLFVEYLFQHRSPHLGSPALTQQWYFQVRIL